MQPRIELPVPDAAALDHSRRLLQLIAARIEAAGGWIDFADYMELALYAPGLGYYSAGAAKFGPAGDFVTAPEISPLFGRCLARACAPWLRAHPEAHVLELGAGSGALAVEMLTALERLSALPARYLILEVSADLRERQQAACAALPPRLRERVHWLDALPATPLAAIVLANEVVDALPVSRFIRRADGVRAEGVAWTGGRPGWREHLAPAALADAVADIERDLGAPLPAGYRSEINQRLPAWMASLAAVVGTGALLISDYGMSRREYYHAQRSDGTLTCHYRHRAHGDPFLHPGLQDITAWVDFTALATAASAAGLVVAGYATQAHFLLDAGVGEELAAMTAAPARAQAELARQARMLMLPGEMGERFKVMALARDHCEPGGFGFRDLRHLL